MLFFCHFYCVHCVQTVNIVFTIHWIWCIHCTFTVHSLCMVHPLVTPPLLMPPWWYPSGQTPPRQTPPYGDTPPARHHSFVTSPVRRPPRADNTHLVMFEFDLLFSNRFIYSEKRCTHTDLKSSNRMKISWLEPELWQKCKSFHKTLINHDKS